MKKLTKEALQQENEKLKNKLKKESALLKALKENLDVEASLERVRVQALSMRNQDGLSGICEILFTELKKFGFADLRNMQIIINHDDHASFIDYDYSDYAGSSKTRVFYESHIKTREFINQIKKADDAFAEFVISGDELDEWRNWRKKNGEADEPKMDAIDSLHYYFYSIGIGAIGISAFKPISEKELEILKRFRNVFGLAYRRYMDVTQAEAQAREAQIELGLERVRARAMAMQKSEELAELVDTVFKELTKLDFALTRCIIWIIDSETLSAKTWMANAEIDKTPECFLFKYVDIPYYNAIIHSWKERKPRFIYELKGQEKRVMDDLIFNMPEMARLPVAVRDGMRAVDHAVLSFSFNNFGALQADGLQPLSDDQMDILARFSRVFDLTYTRFSDLKLAEYQAEQARLDLIKLQTEKRRAEDALSELRATQSQLIQSEKMASLGELTAGIAHEIQNPLNFVNNFSEVSNELVEEMNAEIDKGDMNEAKAIAKDIKQNLEKITHHGKRADAIVKSMLQHSRSSSGVKEPTNINALADEYLRLAYHGFRAKDMNFNATLKTDYDETAGSINIISQDIGRVILNLITNAFYAVSEKKKSGIESYEPTVSVSTKRYNGNIEIKVSDNGNGIPQTALDKIFQPFFTTKPTGQGTGLGLSLSCDIVKAHGGEIRVKTNGSPGAEFMVQIPVA